MDQKVWGHVGLNRSEGLTTQFPHVGCLLYAKCFLFCLITALSREGSMGLYDQSLTRRKVRACSHKPRICYGSRSVWSFEHKYGGEVSPR